MASLTYRLVFVPHAWQTQFARWPVETSLVAHLGRNDYHGGTRELIVHNLRPLGPDATGRHFGPLDDLLLLRREPRLDADDARRLLARFGPGPRQLIAALTLGVGAAADRWQGIVSDEGVPRPLGGFTLVGPGMVCVDTRTPVKEPFTALERWSRTRGALGEAVWLRLRKSHIAVVGAGRTGSAMTLTLALLGVGRLTLIDEDVEQLHNLDATVLTTPDGVGRPKVVNRAAELRRLRPDDLEVTAVPRALPHPAAVEALRAAALIVTAVDRDVARLTVAQASNRWGKVHLDVGTGVFDAGPLRQAGADVRLLLPGEACVACLGGLRRPELARYELEAPAGALRPGPPVAWHEQRAGSLLTLNQMAVNLAVQLWLDLLAGAVRRSRWHRLEWVTDASVALRSQSALPEGCAVCRPGWPSIGKVPVHSP